MTKGTQIGRRHAMALMGGGAAALAIAPAHAVKGKAPSSKIDFGSTQGRLRTYMLMRGAYDDRLVIGCVSGIYYGVVDAETKPLYGVVSATFARYRPMADGGFEAATTEQAYFTDLRTGQWIKEYSNPYTGETVAVPTAGYKANRIIITPDVDLKVPNPMMSAKIDHIIMPPEVRGDDVWVTEVTSTSATIPGSDKPFRYSESVTLHSRASDLQAKGAKRVKCETAFTGVVSWRPWLKMGNRPGHLLGIGSGVYGATPETLPAEWIRATKEARPELIDNPLAALDPVWNAKS